MSGRLKYTLVVSHPDTMTPVALLAGQPVPDWAAELVHPDDFEGSEDAEGSSSGGYGGKTNAQLEAAIADRNEGRDDADLIKPASTKKADLVAALEADDQEHQA